HSSSSGEAWQ
ncbi:hypothetical protein KPH14_000795, partial [Odynerus spinipes]